MFGYSLNLKFLKLFLNFLELGLIFLKCDPSPELSHHGFQVHKAFVLL